MGNSETMEATTAPNQTQSEEAINKNLGGIPADSTEGFEDEDVERAASVEDEEGLSQSEVNTLPSQSEHSEVSRLSTGTLTPHAVEIGGRGQGGGKKSPATKTRRKTPLGPRNRRQTKRSMGADRGRPVSRASSTTAVTTTKSVPPRSTTTTTASQQQSRKMKSPPQQPHTVVRNHWSVEVRDVAPDRLVNPLIELPGRSVPVLTDRNAAIMGTLAAATPATGNSNGSFTMSSGSAGVPPLPTVRSSDLQKLLELQVPAHADTFPLAYYARLLGFNVPLISARSGSGESSDVDDKSESEEKDDDQKEEALIEFPDVRLLQRLPPRNEHTIPPRGTFARTLWRTRRLIDRTAEEEDEEEEQEEDTDLRVLGQQVDPLWQALLVESPQRQEGGGNTMMRPMTAAQAGKLRKAATAIAVEVTAASMSPNAEDRGTTTAAAADTSVTTKAWQLLMKSCPPALAGHQVLTLSAFQQEKRQQLQQRQLELQKQKQEQASMLAAGAAESTASSDKSIPSSISVSTIGTDHLHPAAPPAAKAPPGAQASVPPLQTRVRAPAPPSVPQPPPPPQQSVTSVKPQQFGFVLRSPRRPLVPMATVLYTFQWFPVPEGATSANAATSTASPNVKQSASGPIASVAIPTPLTPWELILTIQKVHIHTAINAAKTGGGADPSVAAAVRLVKDCMILSMTALAMEHARQSNVWYATMLLPVPPPLQGEAAKKPSTKEESDMTLSSLRELVRDCLAMQPLRKEDGSSSKDGKYTQTDEKRAGTGLTGKILAAPAMVADLHKSSLLWSVYAWKARLANSSSTSLSKKDSDTNSDSFGPHRWLLQLPSAEEVAPVVALTTPAAASSSASPSSFISSRPKRLISRRPSSYFSGAPSTMQAISVHVRVELKAVRNTANAEDKKRNEHSMVLSKADDSTGSFTKLPPLLSQSGPVSASVAAAQLPPLDLLRNFPLYDGKATTVCEADEGKEDDDELVDELKKMQSELKLIETDLEPYARSLMEKVVNERREYHSKEARRRRFDEKHYIQENYRMLERRKEMDLAWQKQLEQDMNAVCHICNDGEVIPSNQILFCEACNVAVHQVCYGVIKVPEGDYYCMPCRHLGRDVRLKGGAPKIASPLPICCELCPLKQGAFIRTNMPTQPGETSTFGKWVHAGCAKWQGLNFVNEETQDLIEDVTELKQYYRRLEIACQLCRGERGAMNKCRLENCKNWIHVTCARALGNCEVIHGENCEGPVASNPWSLLCPEHSEIPEESLPKGAITRETLVNNAKEFPAEPKPPPAPIVPIPFNTANGEERKALLADPSYEKALLLELTTKKLFGARCEVCDSSEEGNLSRCAKCMGVVCFGCKLEADESEGTFKCPGCVFQQKNKLKEGVHRPSCVGCYQEGGLLRKAFAQPVNKKSYWSHNPKKYAKSMFNQQLWAHFLCTMWNPSLVLLLDTGEVDCSNVVMSNGNGLILSSLVCSICGQTGGLKVKCSHEGCRVSPNSRNLSAFHVTCARSLGLEVATEEHGRSMEFVVNCYRHGGNEFNLRARLEDLIEIEKRRSGKDLAREENPMTFSHASRIMNASIVVMRMLGWAWRWAEWWVDYGSSWEPLLEPGQKESKMTKEELKIVDSTRESRCADARKCRLAAFGAALRNREYDTCNEFDRDALDRGLRAILHTESLVGPLEDYEVDFFAAWLGRAYRSKSRLLGYGDEKIPVSQRNNYCVYTKNQTAKFELGTRPLPGRASASSDTPFEEHVDEVDDLMENKETLPPISLGKEPQPAPTKARPQKVLPKETATKKVTTTSCKEGSSSRVYSTKEAYTRSNLEFC